MSTAFAITKQVAADAVGNYRRGNRARFEAPLLAKALRAPAAADPVAALSAVLAPVAADYKFARMFPRHDHTPEADRETDYAAASRLLLAGGHGLTSVAAVIAAVPFIAGELRKTRRQDGKPYVTGMPLVGASKWLWFCAPEVGVIFDSRARGCMRRLGYRMPDDDYPLYCRVFQHLLREHIGELEDAGRELADLVTDAGFRISRRAATRKALDLVLYWNSPEGEVPDNASLEDGDLFVETSAADVA